MLKIRSAAIVVTVALAAHAATPGTGIIEGTVSEYSLGNTAEALIVRAGMLKFCFELSGWNIRKPPSVKGNYSTAGALVRVTYENLQPGDRYNDYYATPIRIEEISAIRIPPPARQSLVLAPPQEVREKPEKGYYLILSRCRACYFDDWQHKVATRLKAAGQNAMIGWIESDPGQRPLTLHRDLRANPDPNTDLVVGPLSAAEDVRKLVASLPSILGPDLDAQKESRALTLFAASAVNVGGFLVTTSPAVSIGHLANTRPDNAAPLSPTANQGSAWLRPVLIIGPVVLVFGLIAAGLLLIRRQMLRARIQQPAVPGLQVKINAAHEQPLADRDGNAVRKWLSKGHPRLRLVLRITALVACIVVFFHYAEPRSQSVIVRNWEAHTGAIDEAILSLRALDFMHSVAQVFLQPTIGFRFAPLQNRYYSDGFGRVSELRLRSASIHSLDELKNLNQLKHLHKLDLMGNALTGDLDFSLLQELEVLSLSRCRDIRLLGIEKLTKLKRLTIRFCGIRDPEQLRSLAGHRGLEHLDLSGNPLWPHFQAQAFQADELLLTDTQVREIPSLSGFKKVDLSRSPIQSLSELATVETLNLTGATLDKGLSLQGATSLEALTLNDATLPLNLKELRFPHLGTLSMRGTRNISLRAIVGNTELGILELDRTEVSDIAPLKSMAGLYMLSLRDTAVHDLTPLRSLPHLFALRLSSSRISDREARQQVGNRTLLFFDHAYKVSDALSPAARLTLGTALMALAISPFLLSLAPFGSRIHSTLPFQLAKLWRAAGIYAILGYVLGTVMPDAMGQAANLACALTCTWIAVHTAALTLSRTRQCVGSTVPLWILSLRRAPTPLLFLGPFAYMMAKSKIGWIGDIAMALFGSLGLALPLLQWHVGFRPVGGLPGFLKDLLGNRARRLRATLPAYNAIRNPTGKLLFQNLRPYPVSRFAIPHHLQFQAVRSVLDRQAWIESERPFTSPELIEVELERHDLTMASRWEFESQFQWIEDVWRLTAARTWLIGDWLNSSGLDMNGRAERRLERLLPLITTFSSSREGPMEAGKLNDLLAPRELADIGLRTLLTESSTLTARLMRQVFTAPQLAERIDLLMRATETALAHFVLAMTAEYEANGKSELRGDEVSRIGTPTFKHWLDLAGSYRKRPHTPLSDAVTSALERTGTSDARELANMLRRVGSPSEQVNKPPTVRGSFEILVAARNLITAHGPLAQHADESLYRIALLTVLDTLKELPWNDAVLAARCGDEWLLFQGCAPTAVNDSSLRAEVAIRVPSSGGNRWVDAERWFQPVRRFQTFAYYAGSEFVDPVTGVRMTTDTRRTDAAHL